VWGVTVVQAAGPSDGCGHLAHSLPLLAQKKTHSRAHGPGQLQQMNMAGHADRVIDCSIVYSFVYALYLQSVGTFK
jgi:hypothetical protein